MIGAMKTNETALERAFALAKSGRFTTLLELRVALAQEGHRADQIDGPALGRQLRDIIRKSRDDPDRT